MPELLRTALRLLLAAAFVFAGTMHFLKTDAYVSVVPGYLKNPQMLVYVSGVCEILGGIGVLLPAPIRPLAAWGLILLLIAVFPANVQIALHGMQLGKTTVAPIWGWIRLPFQLLFIYWVWWSCLARAAQTVVRP